jgi:hypothetical protein
VGSDSDVPYSTLDVVRGTEKRFISHPLPCLGARIPATLGRSKLTSNQIFKVKPQITSFTPTTGAAGTSVTITGVSLQATKVTFGGVKASFLLNSATEVTATVPTGAKTGQIAITTAGGSVSSSGVFTVTP